MNQEKHFKRGRQDDDEDSEEAGLQNVKVQTAPQLMQIMDGTLKTTDNTTILHILGHNTTVSSALNAVQAHCNLATNFTVELAALHNPNAQTTLSTFHGSSLVLTLDGFNQSAAEGGTLGSTWNPMPSTIDSRLVSCVNQTLAQAMSEVTSSAALTLHISSITLGLACILYCWTYFACKSAMM